MSDLKLAFEAADFRRKLSEAQLYLQLLASVADMRTDEQTRSWLKPQLEPLEERLAALEQCRVVMTGSARVWEVDTVERIVDAAEP
jgi:hypothetical protein